MGGKTLTHKEYLASDVWKCTASPTGAHHWIEIQHAIGKDFHTGLFYCKWCRDSREFPTDWGSCNRMFTIVGEED